MSVRFRCRGIRRRMTRSERVAQRCTPAASRLWGFVVCRCAVCAVSNAECLLGHVLHISHAIPLRVFQLRKSERWNHAVFEMLARSAVRELHAELVIVRVVSGRSPRLCLWMWVVHPIRRQCTRSDRVQRPVRGAASRNGCRAGCRSCRADDGGAWGADR